MKRLRCRECGVERPFEPAYVCDRCFGPLEVAYDLEALGATLSRASIAAGPPSIWRYRPLLPVDDGPLFDLGTGFTPLVPAHNLGRRLGLNRLYVKNDTVNPTGSFKDRNVTVALNFALHRGFETLACSSTGNLAGSVAAYAALARLPALVFIPAGLEPGKVGAAAAYGATIIEVDGTYDDVSRLCTELADQHPWGFVNVNLRPFYSEGSKTLAFEVVEQLGWRAPDHLVVPVAAGSLLAKSAKALSELHALGLIDAPQTRIHAAQGAGCAPVADAVRRGADQPDPVRPSGLARSLAIGNPADGRYAVRAVRSSGGWGTAASDQAILEGMTLLAECEGILAEPAGGVVVAGLQELIGLGRIQPDETVVLCITGSGLKTTELFQGGRRLRLEHARASEFETLLAAV
ncbi:MAG TPA: threonine synthase [Candidatus Limnocylindrales bacterium]|nr:threonine synthase [Candidatus Limnocylindrales bacterium]